MLYAIVSDIHANLQAWNAVQIDAESIGVDAFICLGDIVGYGPSPVQTLSTVYNRVNHFVAGNHDAALSGLLDEACFNDEAQESIRWTREHFGKEERRFFQEIPFMLQGEGFRCAHANPYRPELFDYVLEPEDASFSWKSFPDQLLFIGHTHCPEIFVTGESGNTYQMPPQDFEAEPNKRYIVNVGSVGLPRDGDRRASYCIFDDVQRSVWFRRIAFDIPAYLNECNGAGINVQNCRYLQHIRAEGAKIDATEPFDFQPPTYAQDSKIKPVVPKTIGENSNRKSRFSYVFAIVSFIFAVSAITLVFWTQRSTQLHIVSQHAREDASALSTPQPGEKIALGPDTATGKVQKGAPLTNWTVTMDAPEHQEVAVEKREENGASHTVMRLTSDKPENIVLLSPPFKVEEGERLRVTGSFKGNMSDHGMLELTLLEMLPNDRKRTIIRDEPERLYKENDRWCYSSATMSSAFSREKTVRMQIKTEYVGEVFMRRCELRQRPD